LTNPSHVVNVQYGGFTTSVNFTLKTPIVQSLTIGSGGTLALSAGSQLPAVQAVSTQGGTASLGAAFPGVTWTLQPRGSTLNTVLNLLGVSLNQVLTTSNGQVAVANNTLFNQVLGNPLLGGAIPIDVRASFQGVNSNLQPATVSN
jgi:hypothetical protein